MPAQISKDHIKLSSSAGNAIKLEANMLNDAYRAVLSVMNIKMLEWKNRSK